MKRNQWLAVVGAMGLAVGASVCAKQGAPPPGGPEVTKGGQPVHTVEGFLSDTGQTAQFDRKLVEAVCQLEDSTEGLDSTKRLCKVSIPTYPP